jgi:Ferritin-like domain
MHSKFAIAAGLSCLSVVSAAPFSFPLTNGFPTIANPSDALTAIELAAHGSLPNSTPPKSVNSDTLTSLKLIAFNELTEVAFFTELIYNITNQVEGYHRHDIGNDEDVEFVLASLTAIQAQEELHLLNANGALAHFGSTPIQPCEYNFPVSTFQGAIALAATFTDVVLGTLQDVQFLAASDGDAGIVRAVASVLGQEGEQEGFYRAVLGKIPSALPFLTTSTRQFAFSALNQGFVVAGTCPNIGVIGLPIFKPLTVTSLYVDPKAEYVDFSIPPISGTDYSTLSITYINQQNVPVVEPIKDVSVGASAVTFKAWFPFNGTTFGNGLTIAALTSGATSFASADAVAAATIAGPGLIEIN